MNKNFKDLLLIVILCILMISILPSAVYANSAEPPSLVILVNNPPEDLSIVLESNEIKPEAVIRRAAWEGYYVFYSRDLQSDDKYTLRVSTKGESFDFTIDAPLQSYNNVYTLDLSHRELTPGKYPFRSALLVSIRLVLTLLLEGIIFWICGFRKKTSWIIFLAINLVTQGGLNIWLNSGGSLLPSYLILSLIIGEFFVFAAELTSFPILIKEHKPLRTLLCVLIANIVSLIAGGYIISVLPV